ncbi:DUF7547 family protein [Halorubrum sp. DTA98]|uniref:DUF7547 family protein n=1 Tax=Halorubrum sp. DTA98 TaxID=3402163 RepID=UPI003AAB0226
MSSRDRPRDDDLEERLDELEDVLSELRRDLKREERARRGPPRPPRLSELLRFTEQYTIPTLIAVLETTIKSLELLRGTLRLAEPGRGLDVDADATADRLGSVRDEASAGLARSLSELRTALSEADLPEDAASRSIVQDARDLTAEIEARIDESRRDVDSLDRSRRSRDGEPAKRPARDDGAISIDVTDLASDDSTSDDPASDDQTDDSTTADAANDDPAPEVDVDSELESIKRQLDAVDEDALSDDAETGMMDDADETNAGTRDDDPADDDPADDDPADDDSDGR